MSGKRALADQLTNLAAWLKRHARVKVSRSPVRVNLGSSLVVADGWLHIDGSLSALLAGAPDPVLKLSYRFSTVQQWYSQSEYLDILNHHIFIFHNLAYGIPLSDDSVELIYTSHLLEHLFRDDAIQLLSECWRVLKSGGRIRICVPDLAHVMALYNLGQKRKALSYFFADSHVGALGRHQYLYDFETLNELLTSTRFAQITRCAFREGAMPDIALLDNRPEETLYVEAVKS
jgi:SAM-dependent methyltransferase